MHEVGKDFRLGMLHFIYFYNVLSTKVIVALEAF